MIDSEKDEKPPSSRSPHIHPVTSIRLSSRSRRCLLDGSRQVPLVSYLPNPQFGNRGNRYFPLLETH